VHAYRVTLPKVSNDGDGLNAFERVILKLLDVFGILMPMSWRMKPAFR
jgi:hypothetical protein